ncbi:MAG: DNA-binding response regulator, partial [Dongiaceae bacterium]
MNPLVLVVEDETALVTLLRYNLEREGFRVAAAGDGEEALL